MTIFEDAWSGIKKVGKNIGDDPLGFVADAAVLTTTGGFMDASGNINPLGMGPGGTAMAMGNKAIGDPLGLVAGGTTPGVGGTTANPGGAAGPVPQLGVQGTAPPAGPEAGLNFMMPGASEAYYAANAGKFAEPTQTSQTFAQTDPQLAGPGQGEQFVANATGKYANGTPGVTQNAQSAYDDFTRNRVDLATDPNMGAYYENAKRRSAEDINRQMAARGAYGASAATDRVAEAFTDLEAERALNEANYGLKRADTIRGFGETAGNLARGADISSEAGSRNERDWVDALGGLSMDAERAALDRNDLRLRGAGQVDDAWSDRMTTGADIADRAQSHQRERGQDYFNNTFDMATVLADLSGGAYEDMSEADKELMDAALAAELGLSSERLNQDYKQTAQMDADFWKTADLATSFYTGGGSRGAA